MIDKNKLEELLKSIPIARDTEVNIIRSMGDALIFFNYEKHGIELFDDYFIFHDDGKNRKVRYDNIIQVKWKPIFKDKPIKIIIDGEFDEIIKED